MDDLERRVYRYRPVGPPAALRMRITALVRERNERSDREWVLPLSAAAAAAMFYTFAVVERRAVLPAEDPTRAALVRRLTEQLGGDESARDLARHIVSLEYQPEVPVE